MKILVLDNYDSFTYNLVHILKTLVKAQDIEVIRNDKIKLQEVEAYGKILLSPGPGVPSKAGIMPELIKKFGSTKSILGVCLGHQGIAEAYGAEIYNMPDVYHGVAHEMEVTDHTHKLFAGIPPKFTACRYHSWTVRESEALLKEFKVTVRDPEGRVMAIEHKLYKVSGVQFHPESIMTEYGTEMIQNWLNI
jgi:anthranilate synthase component 2